MFKSCFVIGHPINHSRSPLIHNHWIAKLGLSGNYQRIDVAPEELAAFVARLRAGELTGGNVTIPHKQAIAPLLDVLTPGAHVTGAVNTLYMEGDLLVGDNTDIIGFLNHLDATVAGWGNRVGKAVVLGAGGAAQAICHGLIMRGVKHLVIVNRDVARAEHLVSRLQGSPAAQPGRTAEAIGWDARNNALADCDLVVNATSLGMKGQGVLDIDLSSMPRHGIAYDIVYVPLETEFLAQARAHGLAVVDGLGMLLHQAAPAFSRWFGIRPEVTPELRAIIEADIR
ncbi:MAG: shikimate dehydrogenase [Bosea sp. (in: a-proteobacteria)]